MRLTGVRFPHEGLGDGLVSARLGPTVKVRFPHEGLGVGSLVVRRKKRPRVRFPHEGLGARCVYVWRFGPDGSDFPMRGWEAPGRIHQPEVGRVRFPHEGLGAAYAALLKFNEGQVRFPHEGLGDAQPKAPILRSCRSDFPMSEPPRVYRRVICSYFRRPYQVCSGLHRTPPLLQRVGYSRWDRADGGCYTNRPI